MNNIIKLFPFFLLAIFIQTKAYTQNADTTQNTFSESALYDLLEKKQPDKAREYLLNFAKKNNHEAQVLLARIYLGEQKLSEDINSWSCLNYNSVEKTVELGKNLKSNKI